MDRRLIRYVLNWLLLAAAVVVIVTGVVVDRLDLNDFTPHRWAGYTVAVLIALHVGLRWRAFLRTRRAEPPSRESAPTRATDAREQFGEPADAQFPVEPGVGARGARGLTSAGAPEGRVGAFLDARVNDLLGVDGRHEAALGLITLGPR